MKDMTISKSIDELGRVVLPIEARLMLSLAAKDSVSFYLDGDGQTLILKKCVPSCFCCQSTEQLRALPHEKYVCKSCLNES